MKKVITMFLLVMMVLLSVISVATAAEDCRVLSLEKLFPNSDIFRFTLDLRDAPAGIVLFDIYKEREVLSFVSNGVTVGGIGKVDLSFVEGEIIEFSIGVMTMTSSSLKYWVDSSCSEYAYKGHLRVRIMPGQMLVGAPVELPPGVMFLLRENKK